MRREASDPRLQSIVESNYGKQHVPVGRVGNGSTADALRYERATGKLLSETGHLQKAIELKTRLEKYIRRAENSPNPTSTGHIYLTSDINYAKEMLKDLNDALGY